MRPYLLQLAAKITQDGGPKVNSISLPVGSIGILVSPFEQQLAVDLSEDHPPENPSHQLVTDAIGMSLAIADALRRYAKAEGKDQETIRNALDTVVGLSYRLSHSMTVEHRQLRTSGAEDEAQHLLTARSQLIKLIEQAEKAAPPAPSKKRENSRFVYEWEAGGSPSAKNPTTAIHTSGGRRPGAGPEPGPRRWQIALLAVLAVVLVVIAGYLWIHRTRQLPDFSPTDFPQVAGIHQVVNRSPALLVVVDDSLWNALDRRSKERAVSSIVTKVRPAGYRRVEIRSPKSPQLAVWSGGETVTITQ